MHGTLYLSHECNLDERRLPVSLMVRKLPDKSLCMIHQSRVIRAPSRPDRNAGNDCIVIYHVFRCTKISCVRVSNIVFSYLSRETIYHVRSLPDYLLTGHEISIFPLAYTPSRKYRAYFPTSLCVVQ